MKTPFIWAKVKTRYGDTSTTYVKVRVSSPGVTFHASITRDQYRRAGKRLGMSDGDSLVCCRPDLVGQIVVGDNWAIL